MFMFIADIHLGVKLPKTDFYDSLELMFSIIKKHKEPCEAIIVCGDLFDHALNIDEAKFAAGFLMHLAFNHCGRNGVDNVPVHIIEGTYSHDRMQMSIYEQFMKHLPCTVFYFPKWCRLTLPSGKKLLYLPQEYGDVDYGDAFDHEYDLIVGHGPMSSINKTVVTAHGTEIMHSVEMLGNISKLCVFGHYHEYTDFGNGVYYAGSMLRFRYGEDTDKVFFMCDDQFNVSTVKNLVAKEFKTIEIHDPEQLRSELANEINTPHRFVIYPTSNDQSDYYAIMNTTKQSQNIKFKVVQEEVIDESTTEQIVDDVQEDVLIESPVESLIHYVNDKYQMDVSKEVHDYETKINRETSS